MADGWTPTDAGLIVDLQPGDKFMLSVWIDLDGDKVEDEGEEFFVCHFNKYNGGRFSYTNGDYLKLIPQPADATQPQNVSVWTIDTALTRVSGGKNYAMGGRTYTMWSSNGYTLYADGGWKFKGTLSNKTNDDNLCDVAFAVPTVRANTNMDPKGTLNTSHTDLGRNRGTDSKTWAFDGKTGTGFLGMIYREVYMFEKPRKNTDITYINTALVGFNLTNGNLTVRGETINKGKALWAYNTNYADVPRTLFRLYILEKEPFNSCPHSYFYAWNEQDNVKYRSKDNPMTDSTAARKIYTTDHIYCMEHIGNAASKTYRTEDLLYVSASDSAYYYVGKNDKYYSNLAGETPTPLPGTDGSFSQFTKIRELPMLNLTGKKAPAGACGRMVVADTAVSSTDNLGVAFEPAGYFLRIHTTDGKDMNIPMHQTGTYEWTGDDKWTITSAFAANSIKAMLYTGSTFSMTDPGVDVAGWSELVEGTTIKVHGVDPESDAASVIDKTGFPRIYTNNTATNGALDFVLANTTNYIHYDNNTHFGDTVPDQYAVEGITKVAAQAPRLLAGYRFIGWTTLADTTAGDFTKYQPGDSIPLGVGKTTLYAQAKYEGAIHVAISFLKDDGKRYFLTHPNSSAPRYARSRHFDDWTDVYQGMYNAENSEPNYLTSYKLIGKETECTECLKGEYVLDSHYEVMHGTTDSLVFYKTFSGGQEEYIGLYYEPALSSVLANNTWAGLFKSTEGWPTPVTPCIDSTRLVSTNYLTGLDSKPFIHNPRHIGEAVKDSVIHYNSASDQFDEGEIGAGTDFMLSGVGVVDAHYVILPDTTDEDKPWTDAITFGFHEETPEAQQVWSKLIGKQLLAQMKVGNDTIYFHPNSNKIFTTANDLRLSSDFRLVQSFSLIHDSRAAGQIAVGDSVTIEETDNGFGCRVIGGTKSPVEIMYNEKPIDIVDTLRVTLRPLGTSKIKEYYGRWKKKGVDDGLTVAADGTRYRDILITSKTYHAGPNLTRLKLIPEQDTYTFGALANQSLQLNFSLIKETYCKVLDAAGNELGEKVKGIEDVTESLALTTSNCNLRHDVFDLVADGTKTSQVTLKTHAENTEGANYDTLTVTIPSITVADDTYTDITVTVYLMQVPLAGSELIWSVVDSAAEKKPRYFIMAGKDGLIFRQYTRDNNILYQLGKKGTHLVKGAADDANSDGQYITPWTYADHDATNHQLKLSIASPVSKALVISGVLGSYTAGVGETASASLLTYEMASTNVNSNANYEEKVRLHFGNGSGASWLKFTGGDVPTLTFVDEANASYFSWGYLLQEYSLLNNGNYPSTDQVEFGYNNTSSTSVTTAYQAYREYSMLLDNQLTYLCRETEKDSADLVNDTWKTTYEVSLIHDSRFKKDALVADSAKLTIVPNKFQTKITPSGDSPLRTKIGDDYVNIVDTLQVTLGLQTTPPDYRFKGDWNSYTSVSDACLKIPLVRKTYHEAPYDIVSCAVDGDEYNYTFPATLPTGEGKTAADSSHTFTLRSIRTIGTNVLDVNNQVVSQDVDDAIDLTDTTGMNLSSTALAEIRLIDEYGNTPTWCTITGKGRNTITVKCTANGVRTPRTAYIYLAYIVYTKNTTDPEYMRFVNFRLTVSQPSHFDYANNQILVHSTGITGDPLLPDGRQQAHENKRILYYYNPKPYAEPDQNVELPIRERGFYGWWRWYREGKDQNHHDVSDTDIPDTVWQTPPRNSGKWNYPFRVIGDSVWIDDENHELGKKLVTMGRYTVFHYPSKGYNSKVDPPSKNPLVYPPFNKDTVTYVVDISNYVDNLQVSMKYIDQIDTAWLDTVRQIPEPTLSLREAFELHPWTEMAERMEGFKTAIPSGEPKVYPLNGIERYMEDHVVMAPAGKRLLLRTEQRYSYDNLKTLYNDKGEVTRAGHSESLLGYYMRDDNWATGGWDDLRKDTMIWCGGWDADCEWFTYNPKTGIYTPCAYKITENDDFLDVPSAAGKVGDTLYFCLRARSKKTTTAGTPGSPDPKEPADGAFYFNICRYKIIYHNYMTYGPKLEDGSGPRAKAIITNDEIEQDYEVLERLNFDYNKTRGGYHIYPRPLPWSDASYGYSYPVTDELPNNRYHDEKDFPGPGEYALINYIPYTAYWRPMQQHGNKDNGYMIYCDGMSSAGQVAALTLQTHLCEGQKMYFSAYVGNVSNQSGKSKPNFTFTVQGSTDGENWQDITSYMTGDLDAHNNWYQIFFPITYESRDGLDYFRIRVYNVASDFDGNDFVLDDMCVFATKPPLIAYQANTSCLGKNESDSVTHVVVRVDYQGFINDDYNGENVYYTVEGIKGTDTTFVPMIDQYLHNTVIEGKDLGEGKSAPDTVYGYVPMPLRDYVPTDEDSIFSNLRDMVTRFDSTLENYLKKKAGEAVAVPADTFFNKGYLYEILDGVRRPVLYVLHKAKMMPDNRYNVRMSLAHKDLMSSICAMTSAMRVTNPMMLELNGEEQDNKELIGLCANTTYDISLRMKGTLFEDNTAPVDMDGSCVNDWLLYGDTTADSKTRYGYYYDTIAHVIEILRYSTSNDNQFARSLSEVNHNKMLNIQKGAQIPVNGTYEPEPGSANDPYVILTNLVNNGFLTLFKSKITASVVTGDSIQYMIFPIEGTGSDNMSSRYMEVCPRPMFIKLKPSKGGAAPLMLGGLKRDKTEQATPVVVLADAATANSAITIRIDSIMNTVAIHSVQLISTTDTNYVEGLHTLNLTPDRIYNLVGDNSGYYKKGDNLVLRSASAYNYQMLPGFSYTFGVRMQTRTGSLTVADTDCEVGTVPFTVSVVPNQLRWSPQVSGDYRWNNPANWIGIDDDGNIISADAHFAPLPTTNVIIPAPTASQPYPIVPDLSTLTKADSVIQVGFQYNTCNDIRFLPGAAIEQQQRLTYNNAIVDMGIPQQKWALRSAPVTGMISGDLFMADADLAGETAPWEVGEFDASGRSYGTGNATFWLSLYNTSTEQVSTSGDIETHSAATEWSKVTNGMTLSLPPAKAWAVYARTASGSPAAVRLPKNDDIYYYYTASGEKVNESYVHNLRTMRTTNATNAGATAAGKLTFNPAVDGTSQSYTISNGASDTMFVFGNPSMGYIDIWNFITDNSELLKDEIGYLTAEGKYQTVTRSSAAATKDTISEQQRYLPPMYGMVVKAKSAATSLTLTLNTSRVVTAPVGGGGGGGAPARYANAKAKAIMTITAVNPVSDRCVSRLLLGQGYHDAILSGEDAVLTTLNIDRFSMTNTPTTPFNLYASEGDYGLSIDLRDSIVYVPLSFYMSNLPYDSVTYLWFTGVNAVEGPLVLYDALLGTERLIMDGICLDIETPEMSHELRYFIRRPGYTPQAQSDDPVSTGSGLTTNDERPTTTYKIFRNGHVYILRDGHVYTMLGQQIR